MQRPVIPITIAVVGHNEAKTLLNACLQASEAAGSQDRVVFVDSGSDDGSADVARRASYEVVEAPLGKGAAVRELLTRIDTAWAVLLDADLVGSERNLALPLVEAVRADPAAACVLGDFVDRRPGVLSCTEGIYRPLVRALEPAAADLGRHPLTGFRAVAVEPLGDLSEIPDDFGLEAHLNLRAARSGRGVSVVELGWYEGRFLYKPFMGREIARAILNEAERAGVLSARARPEWDVWVDQVVDVISGYRGDGDYAEYERQLLAVADRAMPHPR